MRYWPNLFSPELRINPSAAGNNCHFPEEPAKRPPSPRKWVKNAIRLNEAGVRRRAWGRRLTPHRNWYIWKTRC